MRWLKCHSNVCAMIFHLFLKKCRETLAHALLNVLKLPRYFSTYSSGRSSSLMKPFTDGYFSERNIKSVYRSSHSYDPLCPLHWETTSKAMCESLLKCFQRMSCGTRSTRWVLESACRSVHISFSKFLYLPSQIWEGQAHLIDIFNRHDIRVIMKAEEGGLISVMF